MSVTRYWSRKSVLISFPDRYIFLFLSAIIPPFMTAEKYLKASNGFCAAMLLAVISGFFAGVCDGAFAAKNTTASTTAKGDPVHGRLFICVRLDLAGDGQVAVITQQDYRQEDKKTKTQAHAVRLQTRYTMTVRSGRNRLMARVETPLTYIVLFVACRAVLDLVQET